jgi:hypothetical protein
LTFEAWVDEMERKEGRKKSISDVGDKGKKHKCANQKSK